MNKNTRRNEEERLRSLKREVGGKLPCAITSYPANGKQHKKRYPKPEKARS